MSFQLFPQKKHVRLLALGLALGIGCTHLPAAEAAATVPAAAPASKDAKPAFTPEQATAMDALKSELARLDPMLAKVEEADHKAWVQGKVDQLKERFQGLQKGGFDQTKFDELRFDVNIEYQRLAVWLRPPLVPARGKAK